MQNKKILIVDDIEMNREMLTEILEDDYQIETVDDAEKAIKILSERIDEFAVLLLDLVMPNKDGFMFDLFAHCVVSYVWLKIVLVLYHESPKTGKRFAKISCLPSPVRRTPFRRPGRGRDREGPDRPRSAIPAGWRR